jgi:hypothetical protein
MRRARNNVAIVCQHWKYGFPNGTVDALDVAWQQRFSQKNVKKDVKEFS